MVLGEVRHLEPIEHGKLDRLLGRRGQEQACLVELPDDVDRGEVRATEPGEPAPERESRADPAQEPSVGERSADVGDRGPRQAEAAADLTRPGRVPGAQREQVQDRRGAGDGRRHGLGLDRFDG
jgi:hypothetical protein